MCKFSFLPALVLVAIVGQGCASSQTTFKSPDEAVNALVNAARAEDVGKLSKILGPDSESILASGDPVADREGRDRFVQAYDEKHQLTPAQDGSMTLTVASGDWPFPIPIIKEGNAWRFDTASGVEEVLNRRIGRNELETVQVCMAIADAQREYAANDPDGDGLPDYAKKLVSDPGTKNGLYWPTREGEEPSPLGPLAAAAADEGYGAAKGQVNPFHGYYYRLLTAQGPSAKGGAMDYLVDDKLLGGFAVVACPAIYGNSGVMTFIVNHEGVVYERDLGPQTSAVARAMSVFDPDPSWSRVGSEK
jgi:hypothetical protein